VNAAHPQPDQFTLELIKGALNAARREMEALIARTAMSPFIREKPDPGGQSGRRHPGDLSG
jgi:hypothetical protein